MYDAKELVTGLPDGKCLLEQGGKNVQPKLETVPVAQDPLFESSVGVSACCPSAATCSLSEPIFIDRGGWMTMLGLFACCL